MRWSTNEAFYNTSVKVGCSINRKFKRSNAFDSKIMGRYLACYH
nr:MAG TPA: hypothetical protein [Caudoviricetes sp.]